VFRKALALLDHPWLTRGSNAAFLVGVVAFVGAKVGDVLHHVGWLTIVGVVLMGLGSVRLILEFISKRQSAKRIGPLLGPELYAEQKAERTRRAKQIAREEIDREAKI
jgi:hypothetical protein